ncbi:nitrous oxide reductase family maturation protein NosD [Thalassotalea aquiviva]|uniref:right-handed parallel beta-helix repeat-containing protein n=1 Tax=Thalassotalea aquiviva TaxID=3242415 RepID=UPI00352A35F1
MAKECTVLPDDNIWNTKVINAPEHQQSQTWLDSIPENANLHPDFGAGLYKSAKIGIPVNYVDNSTPLKKVLFKYHNESDHQLYPIPNFVQIEGGAKSKGDRHIIALNTDTCTLYEIFNARRRTDGKWTGGSGAIFDLSSNTLRPKGWTSADAAGLPIYPGLVKYSEVASGEINHALRFTLTKTGRHYVWPARHFASRYKGNKYPPMGARLRLKSTVDPDNFSDQVKPIVKALQTYGMILADNGGDLFITGIPDENWRNQDLKELATLNKNQFEFVDVSSYQIAENSGLADPNNLNGIISKQSHKTVSKPLVLNNKANYINGFYVSPNGRDANDGSFSSPWRTIQHAANLAEPGDVINILSGSYAPFIVKRNGMADKPITFNGNGSIIDGWFNSNRDGIEISANHIVVRGFKIKYANRAGISALNCKNVLIEENEVNESKVWGIFTGFCDDLIVHRNVASNSQKEHGIYISNTSQNIQVSNNHVFGNYASGIHLNGDRHMGKEGIIKNAKIYNNKIIDNGTRGGSGINLDGVQYSLVFNNILDNNRGNGIALFKIDGGESSKYNKIIHNTVIMPSNGRWCALFKNGSIFNQFINNICLNQHSYRGAITIDNASLEGFYSNNNVLSDRFTFDGGESVINFANWQGRSKQDGNSALLRKTSLDNFINRINYQVNSQVIGIEGLLIEGIEHDFHGQKRKPPITVGAIQ